MSVTTAKHQSIQAYSNTADFFHASTSFLCEREAENNLILGIGGILGTPSSPYENYFLASFGAPKVEGAFMMTPPHKLIISYPASEASMSAVIDYLRATKRALPGINGQSEIADHFAKLWATRTGEIAEVSSVNFCYRLSTVQEIPTSQGRVRTAASTDIELMVDWSKKFDIDAYTYRREEALIRQVIQNGIDEGNFYIWEDDEPVSMARASGTTPAGVRISAVYTPSQHRGRGYASSLVAAVSQIKLNEGKSFCFLFTDAANATSNSIYQRIGYEQVCKFHEYEFRAK
jgi:hypothetical protein